MNVLAALSTISDGAGNPLVAVTDFTPGAGGKVSITAPVLAANDGAHIETSTVWDGNAGAIEVNVGSLTAARWSYHRQPQRRCTPGPWIYGRYGQCRHGRHRRHGCR